MPSDASMQPAWASQVLNSEWCRKILQGAENGQVCTGAGTDAGSRTSKAWHPVGCEGREGGGGGSRRGMTRQDILIPFNFTKLALLMGRGGCGPGQILQSRMEATVALGVEGPSCFWDAIHRVFTFCLLWIERLARDDSSSVQHPCWGPTEGLGFTS